MAVVACRKQGFEDVAGHRLGRLGQAGPRIRPPCLLPCLLHQRRRERRGQVAHAVERLPAGNAAVQRGRGRAGKLSAQANCDQLHRHILRRTRLFRQVLRVIEDEAQRHLFILGPVQRPAKGGHLPCRDIGQVTLPGPQGVGRRAAPVEIGQRCFVGVGQLGISGKGEVLRCHER